MKEIVISVCVLAAVVFCAFSPAVQSDFLNWDDNAIVTDNVYLQNPSFAHLGDLLFSPVWGAYQPVVNLSFLSDRLLFGFNPAAFHAVNILLHFLNCVLVLWLVSFWGGGVAVALVTALLFALHPLRVESVAWVSERKDMLFGFFFLAALGNYCLYVQRKSAGHYGVCLGLFLLSLGSKPMAASLPILLFAVDYFLGRPFTKKVLWEKLPFFLFAAMCAFFAIKAQGSSMMAIHGEHVVLWRQLLAACYGVFLYLSKLVFPVGLSLVYPYPPQDLPYYVLCGASLLIMSLIAAGTFFSIKFTRKVAFGVLFAAITILPVLQIVPYHDFIIAERYTYLPAIGFFYIVSVGFFYLYGLQSRPFLKAALMALLVAVLVACGILTYQRTKVWKDDITMFDDVIRKYPRAFLMHNNRGNAYMRKGDLARAIADYNEEMVVNPKYPDVYYNRGLLYQNRGDFDPAIMDFRRAIALNPHHVRAYRNLRDIDIALDRIIAGYSQKLKNEPGNMAAYGKRGTAYLCKEDFKNAIADYSRVVESDPGNVFAYGNRGTAYLRKGDLDPAIADYSQAIKLDPRYAAGYDNRATAYFRKKEYAKSWEDTHKAQALGFQTNPGFIEALQKASGREK